MTQTVVLKVAMSCGGCSGAVTRVLNKTEGVDSFEIDMEQQKVTVISSLDPEVVLQTVAKTGKKTAFWEAEAPAPAPTAVAETEVAETEVKAPEAEVKAAEAETKTTEAAAVL